MIMLYADMIILSAFNKLKSIYNGKLVLAYLSSRFKTPVYLKISPLSETPSITTE